MKSQNWFVYLLHHSWVTSDHTLSWSLSVTNIFSPHDSFSFTPPALSPHHQSCLWSCLRCKPCDVCLCPCQVKGNMIQLESGERSETPPVPPRPTEEVWKQLKTATAEWHEVCVRLLWLLLCFCHFVLQEMKRTSTYDKVKPRVSEESQVCLHFYKVMWVFCEVLLYTVLLSL